nr:malonate decarboxylase holo-[acyl-carrier-protein] synthase [Noviherbaspirillum saxi]
MLNRHFLVWLSSEGWDSVMNQVHPGNVTLIEEWCTKDWPAIARRHEVGIAEDQICVGIAGPPRDDGTRPRVPLAIPRDAVSRTTAPISLDRVISVLPTRWHDGITTLLQEAANLNITLRVYGSASWQFITGQPYVRNNSDIDILCYPRTQEELKRIVDLLDHTADQLPLDGEVVFPSMEAVAWKEWQAARHSNDGRRVLVKGCHKAYLAKMDTLLHTFETTQ